MKRKIYLALISSVLLLLPNVAEAHAFGQKFTLPIPVWMYLFGGAATLIVSFTLIGLFVGKHSDRQRTTRTILKIHPALILVLRILSILALVVMVVAGYIGSQSPTESLTVYWFWIYIFLGVTYLSAMIGNVWDYINPWRNIGLLFFNRSKALVGYPVKLGVYPALIFFVAAIWLELLSEGVGVTPTWLSMIISFYTLIQLYGAYIFGAEKWNAHGEFLSVFMNLVSRVAPFKISDNKVVRGGYAVGLTEAAGSSSVILFIMFMLSSTAFDGFRSTVAWWSVIKIIGSPTLVLLLSPILFLALYLLAIWLMKLITKTQKTFGELTRAFIYSLLPIALAYNIAHYYTIVVVQGQFGIPLLSDPFNMGWNLFGTASFMPNVGILSAKFVWNSEVAVILGGHILAVYIAHMVAVKLFGERKKAIVSQLPMLVLMILYTVVGLWILSQPLTLGS